MQADSISCDIVKFVSTGRTLGSLVYSIMSFVNRPICMLLSSFLLEVDGHAIMRRAVVGGHPCLLPDFSGIASLPG